jgi:hypothetical protein
MNVRWKTDLRIILSALVKCIVKDKLNEIGLIALYMTLQNNPTYFATSIMWESVIKAGVDL